MRGVGENEIQERGRMKQLFQLGDFRLHGGQTSPWKIDCDALSDEDLATLADWARRSIRPFGSVEGVPTGGLRFAAALAPYVTAGEPPLIVDDVLTTGGSMEVQRAGRHATGLVIFARSDPQPWIKSIFRTFENRFSRIAHEESTGLCKTHGNVIIGIGGCHACAEEAWGWKERALKAEAEKAASLHGVMEYVHLVGCVIQSLEELDADDWHIELIRHGVAAEHARLHREHAALFVRKE